MNGQNRQPKCSSELTITSPLSAKNKSTAASPWLNGPATQRGSVVNGIACPSIT